MRVGYSYLQEQFADLSNYLADIAAVVRNGDFTLGTPVADF